MKHCVKCGNEIPRRLKIDGIVKNLQHRKYCLDCSPFGKHNTRKIETKSKNYKRIIEIICLNCNKNAIISINSQGKYCSIKCQNNYQYKQYIERWLQGLEIGCVKGGLRYKVSSQIRQYMFEINDNKCQECGWSKVSKYTGKIPLQVDHIDGDHKNNQVENLRLLCPNCHTLTANYGSLNKGKGRPYKLDYYHQNKLTIQEA